MIIKLQQGGEALPPLVSYLPVTVTGGATAGASEAPKDNRESSDLTDKDLLKMLEKLNGLPSDTSVLIKELLNFYIDLLYSPFPSTSNIASRYILILGQLNNIKSNHDDYNKVFDIVSNNGGINEFAISDRGQLYCMNKDGDFKLLTVELLKENSEYQPLTNSELLYYRALSPAMAGNNNILRVVANGIGIETVTKQILDIIKDLGTTEKSEVGYFKTKAGNLVLGINDYANAIMNSLGDPYNKTIHDLYSSKLLTKTLAELALLAMVYIWQSLPENAKTLLKLKSDGTNEGAIKMIQSLVSSNLNSTSEFSIKLEEAKEDTNKSSSKDGKKNGFLMDPVSLLQAGYGQQQTITILTKEGGNRGIQVPTVRMPIVKKTGESIGTSATLDDVTTSGFAGYLDFENAHMGGIKIPTVGFKNIAINGTALYTGYLPVDMLELYNSNRVKPDINLLGRYKEAQEKIKRENITDKLEINKVYQEYKLPIMFDGNGDVLMNYKKFGMVNATAIDTAFELNVEFEDLRETLDKNVIENTLSIINKGEKNIDFEHKGYFSDFGLDDYNHVYIGTIFIPVNEDHFTATAGFGNYPTDLEASMIEAKQLNFKRSEIANLTYVNPGTL